MMITDMDSKSYEEWLRNVHLWTLEKHRNRHGVCECVYMCVCICRSLCVHMTYICSTYVGHCVYICRSLCVHMTYICSTYVGHCVYICRSLCVHM